MLIDINKCPRWGLTFRRDLPLRAVVSVPDSCELVEVGNEVFLMVDTDDPMIRSVYGARQLVSLIEGGDRKFKIVYMTRSFEMSRVNPELN
ncbi:hypothetical protein [Singulisphaera sp. PoT]|uniref:hypothetical protein n=1 Tax=Singulisphaera sp. PoT TaxID=3411797 RepID=UPI003BF57088